MPRRASDPAPLQGRGRGAVSISVTRISGRVAPRRSASSVPLAPHSPGSGQPTPRRPAARTAPSTKRVTFTTCARGQARCACWLAIGSPDRGCSRGSQGIDRRRAHGCSLEQLRTRRPRAPQLPPVQIGTLLRTRTYGKEMAAWLAAWLPLARIPGHSKHEGRHR